LLRAERSRASRRGRTGLCALLRGCWAKVLYCTQEVQRLLSRARRTMRHRGPTASLRRFRRTHSHTAENTGVELSFCGLSVEAGELLRQWRTGRRTHRHGAATAVTGLESAIKFRHERFVRVPVLRRNRQSRLKEEVAAARATTNPTRAAYSRVRKRGRESKSTFAYDQGAASLGVGVQRAL